MRAGLCVHRVCEPEFSGVGAMGKGGERRGGGPDSPPHAIIGTDKPCAQEGGDLWEHKERSRGRKGDNEREECGGGSERNPLRGVKKIYVSEDPEKDMTCQWTCGRDHRPGCSHG